MNDLARLTRRGRRGQIAALFVTVFFSATLIGTLGLLFETGLRGQVSTGEYAQPPLLLGAPQSIPVSGDVEIAVPGRAVLPDALVDEISDAVPGSRIVSPRIVPASLADAAGNSVPVAAHPGPALALGDRTLVAGDAPDSASDIVIPRHLASTMGVDLGDEMHVAFGGEARDFTVVGLTSADDAGVDVPDVYLSEGAVATYSAGRDRVSAIGVRPRDGAETDELADLAERHGARMWSPEERGALEVVHQGQAKATLTSAVGAFGGLTFIVTMFTVMALTSLQIRERSRELAMLRVIGATPRQVKHLLLSEVRRVALVAGVAGGLGGPFLGAFVVGVGRSSGVLPRGLEPIVGPLPAVVPVLVAITATEIAVRISARRIVGRGSPLAGLGGSDHASTRSRGVSRVVAGALLLTGGIAMGGAPWYLSGEVGTALAGLSGLMIALSIGLLSPLVVRAVVWGLRRPAQRTAAPYLALSSMRMRAARVGGVLAPIVLGVSLSCTQLLSADSAGAITRDQVDAGLRADLTVTSSRAGIDEETIDVIDAVPGVRSVDPIVAGTVVARGYSEESGWQTLPVIGADAPGLESYADLSPQGGGRLALGRGEVALGKQGADVLHARVGDRISIVLADGQTIDRRVPAVYQRGLGFGEVVLPLSDVQPATASGLPTDVVVTLADDSALSDVEAGIEERLRNHVGLDVRRSATPGDPGGTGDEMTLQVVLLLIIWGYIAIAVVNSLVLTNLARRSELALLHAVGASPAQRRWVGRWEALFLAATACAVGTLAAIPGSAGLAYSLSNGERSVPAPAPAAYLLVVGLTFALVLSASALSARSARKGP